MFRGLLLALTLAGPTPPAPALSLDAPPPRAVHPSPHLDDAVHALAGFVAAGGGYAAAIESGAGSGERLLGAAGAVVGAALGKEAFDAWIQDERASGSDLLAGVAGGGLFIALAALAGS